MISRFPGELPRQVDLHNQGYEWYAFTFDNGSMISLETVSDTPVTDPATGLGESPVLQPLKQGAHDPCQLPLSMSFPSRRSLH
jgi:hypothetical protein